MFRPASHYEHPIAEQVSGADGGGRTPYAMSNVVGLRHRSLFSFAFMTLSENPNGAGWTGHTAFRGRGVELDIDAEMWELGPLRAAEAALEVASQRWPEVEAALLKHPLKLYNESWASPAQGFPRLTAPQFLEKLSLASVAIGQACIVLYFADGDLFAGHSVSVTLPKDQEPIAMVEG